MDGPAAWTAAGVEAYVAAVLRERGRPYTGAEFRRAVDDVWACRP